MALAPFFDRVYGSIGGHLSVSRESLTTLLEGTTVGVLCGPRPSPNDLWIAELSTNLLSRLYPRIAISAPGKHKTALEGLASTINPNIEIAEGAPASTTICVGMKEKAGSIYPSSSGWVARVHHSRPHDHDELSLRPRRAASGAVAKWVDREAVLL